MFHAATAVLFAFSASFALAANASPEISIVNETARIGGLVKTQIATGLPAGEAVTVYVFFGTGEGTTMVNIGGESVPVPMGGAVWEAAQVQTSAAYLNVGSIIPLEQSLVGQELSTVVVVRTASGAFFVSTSSGGPILQDAIA